MKWIFLALLVLSLGLLPRSASAQRLPQATERAHNQNHVRIEAGTLEIEAQTTSADLLSIRVTVQLSNRSSETIVIARLAVTALDTECSASQGQRLLAHEQSSLEFICRLTHLRTRSDPEWDLNRPLVLHLFREVGRVEQQFPLGYFSYMGAAETSADIPAAQHFIRISRLPAPALRPWFRILQQRVEERTGSRFNPNSGLSRAMLGLVLAETLAQSPMRYQNGGDFYINSTGWGSSTVSYPAETLEYAWGACDDFTVLSAFVYEQLHIPYAVTVEFGHVSAAIELPAQTVLPEPLSSLRFSHQQRDWLAVDLAFLRDTREPVDLLKRSRNHWFQDSTDQHWILATAPLPPLPEGAVLGRSWLGSMAGVHLITPSGFEWF